jgi:hypothetical protein
VADVRLAARLIAHRTGAAQPTATARTVRVDEDALLLALLGMAGEHPGTVHAFSVAAPGESEIEHGVVDPRNRDNQYDLLQALARHVDLAWDRASRDGTHPQIVVSGSRATAHLRALAERLCRAADAPPSLLQLGERLAYFADRSASPGQQCLVDAAASLRAQFVTGMAPQEEHHLGALLEWIVPGAGGGGAGPARLRACRAEQLPSGPDTLPDDDRRLLQPALDRHALAALSDDHAAQVAAARAVGAALRPALNHQAALIRRAVAVLRRPGLPDLPDVARPQDPRSVLDRLCEAEADAFAAWRDHLDRPGHRIAFRDTPKAAAYRLAADGAAADNLDAARVLGDRVAREEAVHDGGAVRLRLTAAVAGAPAPRRGLPRRAVVVGSPLGPGLPRPGEVWRQAAPGAPRWLVVAVDPGRAGPLVTLSRPGPANPLTAGDTLDLVKAVPDRHRPRARAVDVARRAAGSTPLLPPPPARTEGAR